MNLATFVRRRLAGAYVVDAWGLDPDLVDLVSPVTSWRWSIEVDGAHHVPVDGPAMLVFNRRFGLSEPAVVTMGLRHASGRAIRLVGVPDVAPVGPWLRRFGAAVDTPAEVAGLLRGGELVLVPLGIEIGARRAGRLDPVLVETALEQGVPIVPVAALGHELGRNWRVVVGPAIDALRTDGSGARPTAEAVDVVRSAVQALLDGVRPPGRLMR